MKKLYAMMTICLIFICFIPNVTAADTSHKTHEKNHSQPSEKMNHEAGAGTFEQQMVDKGIRGEFQIMSLASMNMKDPGGATHHVMVKLFDTSSNQPIKEAIGKVKVIGPDKKEQVNGLKNYNGIFAANFIFNKKDKYGVICLVKINGEKHLFKFWYPHE